LPPRVVEKKEKNTLKKSHELESILRKKEKMRKKL
jgi:hypothetical protein